MVTHELEQALVVDEGGLHDLANTRADFRVRDGSEEGVVDERVRGRVKVANAVLAVVVDGDLDTDRRVDDAQQCRRHAAPRDATPPASAREAGSVGEHSSAHAQHRLGAAQRVGPLELVEQKGEGIEVLFALVCFDDHVVELEVDRLSPLAHLSAIELPYIRVHDRNQPTRRKLHSFLDKRVARRERVRDLPDALPHPAVERLPLRSILIAHAIADGVAAKERRPHALRRRSRVQRHLVHRESRDARALDVGCRRRCSVKA